MSSSIVDTELFYPAPRPPTYSEEDNGLVYIKPKLLLIRHKYLRKRLEELRRTHASGQQKLNSLRTSSASSCSLRTLPSPKETCSFDNLPDSNRLNNHTQDDLLPHKLRSLPSFLIPEPSSPVSTQCTDGHSLPSSSSIVEELEFPGVPAFVLAPQAWQLRRAIQTLPLCTSAATSLETATQHRNFLTPLSEVLMADHVAVDSEAKGTEGFDEDNRKEAAEGGEPSASSVDAASGTAMCHSGGESRKLPTRDSPSAAAYVSIKSGGEEILRSVSEGVQSAAGAVNGGASQLLGITPRPVFYEQKHKGNNITCIHPDVVEDNTRFCCLYFHANACDIGQARHSLQPVSNQLELPIVVFEYPGYGVLSDYELSSRGVDVCAKLSFMYIVETLGYTPDKIFLFGRSIGTGPAAWLAAVLNKHRIPIAGLVLQSPYTSLSVPQVLPAFPVQCMFGRMSLVSSCSPGSQGS
eukprot:GHVS01094983.1.p1 GENE.GHVS01094983.1~~GHVS01094983.1.p1  ORF type:complete len:466 (+),score=71.51 GHVS01094983.1:68-1465(+)